MKLLKKFNEELAKEIQVCAMEKQMNILIGSGCSAISMPLMSNYKEMSQDDRNKKLIQDIIRISKISMYINHPNKKFKNTNMGKNIIRNQGSYSSFINTIVSTLNKTNSRQVPKSANIFTTNYDLFIERAINEIQHHQRFVFNDGSNGYFERILDSTNYNRVVAYKGLNDNYISEIPSINLIKSHGSVNWLRKKDEVIVLNNVCDSPMVVSPTGYESQETFLNNYFHDMLRVFQLELDKPQSVLLVIGFSFQDKHISRMLNRALQNPELIVYIFVYKGNGDEIKKNLSIDELPSNLKILTPGLLYSKDFMNNLTAELYEDNAEEMLKSLTFTLDELTELLKNPELEINSIKETDDGE